MSTIASKYRLQSSAFSRPEEENQESPKSAVILSVEGAETERNYFEHLNSSRNDLIFHIEVLRHLKGDGRSAPEDVIDLLNEYIGMRGGDLIPNISDLPSEFTDKYSPSSVKAYLQTPGDFSKAEIDRFNYDLLKLGIDLDYRKYLRNFDSET